MNDRERFTKLLMADLRQKGYEAILDENEIKVTKEGIPVTDILGSGEYRLYRNTHSDEYLRVRSIYESFREAYNLYEIGTPVSAQPTYRILCEFGDCILAAAVKSLGFMEFVTWQQDTEKTRVDAGHYTTDYKMAKQDLALRAGLIDRNKMFSETELTVIHQGLLYLGTNYPDLTSSQMKSVGEIIEKIEMIVPVIKDRDGYEQHNLLPEDGLEI